MAAQSVSATATTGRERAFKRNQIVIVGVAGVHNQWRGRIVRRDSTAGYWIVREIPADAERAAFLKRLHPAINGACVHESHIAVAS